MTRIRALAVLLLLASHIPGAWAEVEPSRAAALDRIERGTAAFRVGDMVSATREWSDAIRLSRLLQAADLEAQALARRGELYRTQGYLRDADEDLRAALGKAEASGNQRMIAASCGAL